MTSEVTGMQESESQGDVRPSARSGAPGGEPPVAAELEHAQLLRPAWIFCWGVQTGDDTIGARNHFFHGDHPRQSNDRESGFLWLRPDCEGPVPGDRGFRLAHQSGVSRRGILHWGLVTHGFVVPVVSNRLAEDVHHRVTRLMMNSDEPDDYWARARVGLDDGATVEAVVTRSRGLAQAVAEAFEAAVVYRLDDDIDRPFGGSPVENVFVEDRSGETVHRAGYPATFEHLARVPTGTLAVRTAPALGSTCPTCGNDVVVPIQYGLMSGPPDPAEPATIRAGCIVTDADRGCQACGTRWAPDAPIDDQRDDWRWPVGEVEIDNMKDMGDTASDLAGSVVVHAVSIEQRAAALGALGLLAEGLCVGLASIDWPAGSRDRAEHLADWISGEITRTLEAGEMARRVVHRVVERIIRFEDAGEPETEPDVYEEILSTRIHLPIAEDIVKDAESEATLALRGLARVAAGAVALSEESSDKAALLARRAGGVLRMALPGHDEPGLANEDLEVWSTDLGTLELEIAGLLANLMGDHRTFLILSVGDDRSGGDGRAEPDLADRYLQCITYEEDLLCEGIGDEFCATPLMREEKERLLELGWADPAADPAATSPNWTREFEAPVPVGQAARLLVQTLTEVHGLASPGELQIQVAATIGLDDEFD